MNWKNLKAFAIVILLVLDLVFLTVLWSRENADSRYDSKVVSDAIALFRESGLVVQESFFDERITLPVYTGFYDEAARASLLAAWASDGISVSRLLDGMSCRYGDGTLTLGDDFSFTYRADGVTESASSLWEACAGDAALINVRTRERLLSVVMSFLKGAHFLDGKTPYQATPETVYETERGFVVQVRQKIGESEMENTGFFWVLDDTVLAAEGVFVPIAPSQTMSAECTELLDILVSEKRRLDEENAAAGEIRYRVLSSVEYLYRLYFDASGEFYLIPLCRIRYADGETVLYHFLTGEALSDS